MDSYSEICRLWSDDSEMAEDVGASPSAVQKWRQRDKIPPGWWGAVVEAARKRQFKGVNLQRLAHIAEERRGSA